MLGDIIYSQEEQNEDRNESRNGNEDENVREMKNENKVEKENRNEEEKEKKVKERERNADVVTRKSKRRGGVSRDRGTYQALIPILEEASRGNINYQISINNDNDNNNNDNNSNNNNNDAVAVHSGGVSTARTVGFSGEHDCSNKSEIDTVTESESTDSELLRNKAEMERAKEALITVRRTGRMEGLLFT